MFDFLKKKPGEEGPEQSKQQHYTAAPGTEIRYNPQLIEQLKHDHEGLLESYLEIKKTFEAGEFQRVCALLDDFRTALQGHLLTENVRLYVYLSHQLAADEFNSDLIRGFRREMDGIGKTVMQFLEKYEAIGVDRELSSAFAKDFEAIGEILVKRIRKEEEVLYPLYMPSY